MINELANLRFTTDRLILRPLIADDLKWVYELHSKEQVNLYLPYDTWTSWEDARYWLAKVEERRRDSVAEQFVVCTREGESQIGTAIVFNYEESDSSVHIGYVLDTPYWGRGLMSELVAALVNALSEQTKLELIRATVEEENHRSIKLLKRLGFEIEEIQTEDEINLLVMSRPI